MEQNALNLVLSVTSARSPNFMKRETLRPVVRAFNTARASFPATRRRFSGARATAAIV